MRSVRRISRRRFLVHGGASLAGAVIAGSTAGRWLDAAAATTHSDAARHGTLTDTLASIVADLDRNFPYASALFTSSGGIDMTRDRSGKSVSESPNGTRGVALRVFDGASFHDASVASTDPDALRAAAKRLLAEVPVAKARYEIAPLSPHRQSWRTPMKVDPDSIPLPERAARMDHEYERAEWDDPRIRNVQVSTSVRRVERVFVDRARRLDSTTTTVNHNMLVFGFDKGHPGFAFERRVGQGGLELATLTDEMLEHARKQVVETFGAGQVPAGEYEVVFAPPVSGLLAHESFGHGVEMDQFVKGRARAQQFLGKPVASKIVNLFDDPSVAGVNGSYPFDDEGELARPTKIIENGVFVRPLTDLMSATFLGTGRSPNGRTQGWDRKIYARMSNTFFARGDSEVGALMESLTDGLYLEGFRNGIEDPQGWGIQFTANMAREVRNGKFTGRVFVPATVTGYVPEILSRITMVANDFALEPGTCGKGFKEFVPVSSGGPHLRTRARVS